ncbi:MAG: metallophosphoesterase [bacterium]
MNIFNRKKFFYPIALLFILFFASPAPRAEAAGNAPGTIKFVQITDNHFTNQSERVNVRMLKYSKDLLEDAIGQINGMPGISFVIFTGDLADSPDANLHTLFTQTANTLNVPWYWTTGNHDLSQFGLNRKQFLKILNKNNKYIQPKTTCYSFAKDGVLFFSMDGASDTKVTAKGFFSKECLGLLDSVLSANSDMPAIIFQHFPLVYPIKSEGHEVSNRDEYLAILDRHPNVKGVFSGHYHIPKIQTRNGVLHVSSPSLIQYPNAFNLVTLVKTADGLKVDVKTIETRLKDVQKMSAGSDR